VNTIRVALARSELEELCCRLKWFLTRPEFRDKRLRVVLLRLWWEVRQKMFKPTFSHAR